MKFSVDRLEVEPIPNEPFRYHVESSRKGEPPYLVDLEARYPCGRCTCFSYECKIWPEFKRTLLLKTCKHLQVALEFHALRHIRIHSKQLNSEGE